MNRRRLAPLLLVVPMLMSAAPRPSRLTHAVTYVERSLAAMEQAKPGEDVDFPSIFRGAVTHLPGPGTPQAPGNEPILSLVAILTDGGAGLRAAGFELGTVTRRAATLYVPISRLHELETVPGVLRVNMAMPVKPLLNISKVDIDAESAHGATRPPYPPGASTGKGVVAGLVDSGIDLDHEDFKHDDGTTRVLNVWDQNDPQTSPGPPSEFPCGGRSYCGNEWFADQINLGQSRQRDTNGHGTHVAGITAADGSATSNGRPDYQYEGIAPEADIVMVNTAFSSNAIIEGVDYIQKRAGSKASVVNLSLGSQFGPHDGTSDLDIAMEGLSGPGRVLVAAAGNEGDLAIHAEWTLATGETKVFPLVLGANAPQAGTNNDYVWCEAWYDGAANLSFKVASPNNKTVGPIGPGSNQESNTTDGTIIIDNTITNSVSGDRDACVILSDAVASRPPRAGTWNVEVTNQGTGTVEIDLWMALSTLVDNQGLSTDVVWSGDVVDFAELVSSPASSDSVIAVAAYVTRKSWNSLAGTVGYVSGDIQPGRIASFSSLGPRRDGVMKPDIAAPGMGIAATKSKDIAPAPTNQEILQDGQHMINQGTSMASPHVAGTVALILQNNPTYSMREVLTALTATARTDGFTGSTPNATWGVGKLDAGAASGFVVPVRLLSLEVSRVDDLPVVRWTLSENEPGTVFEVERGAAADGPFARVSKVFAGLGPFAWTDRSPAANEPWYRIRATLRTGAVEFFGPVRAEPVAGGIRLWQNVPNPFTATTRIAFTLDRREEVLLEILDVRGRLVHRLSRGPQEAGRHEVAWDGTGIDGRPAAAGVYFYRLTTPSVVRAKRLMLTR